MTALMQGKRGLIMGVANNRSIAWGITKALAGQGAELAFSYQGDALKKRVEPLAQEIGAQVFGVGVGELGDVGPTGGGEVLRGPLVVGEQ